MNASVRHAAEIRAIDERQVRRQHDKGEEPDPESELDPDVQRRTGEQRERPRPARPYEHDQRRLDRDRAVGRDRNQPGERVEYITEWEALEVGDAQCIRRRRTVTPRWSLQLRPDRREI